MVFILSFYRSFSFYRLFGHRVVPSSRGVFILVASAFPSPSSRPPVADLYSMKGMESIRATRRAVAVHSR